mgnify:CR=1 FL=1
MVKVVSILSAVAATSAMISTANAGETPTTYGKGLVVPENLADIFAAAPDHLYATYEPERDTNLRSLRRLPKRLDYVKRGLVTPVKQQGGCGSCWAFSTAAVVEGAVAKATGVLTDFSTQQLVSCSKGIIVNGTDISNNGCKGGHPSVALLNIGQWESYCPTSLYGTDVASSPLGKEDGTCYENNWCNSPAQTLNLNIPEIIKSSTIQVVSSSMLTEPASEETIMRALVELGPLSVTVNAENWQNTTIYDNTGILSNEACYTGQDQATASNDHAVLLVGYGEEKGQKFWKIKNSWNTAWGEEGYIRIERGLSLKDAPKGSCGLGMDVTGIKIDM